MTGEIIIHKDHRVTITNLRLIVDRTTYPIASITSISFVTTPPAKFIPFMLTTIGIIALAIGLPTLITPQTWDNRYTTAFAGTFFTTFGVMLLRNLKPLHNLQITYSTGKAKTFQSPDLQYIQTLAEALNKAITT